MTDQQTALQEQAARGKRLVLYGMFSLVVVTIVALFLVIWLVTLGDIGVALQTSLIVGFVAVIACVIVWFIYTKLILKE